MATVAEVIADQLYHAGITTVFGLPGGENLPLLDAIRRHNIEFVLVRNESSAVFMADVTARLTGVPSAVLTTLGPGATNAYVGIAHAFLDRSPVLLITAETPSQLVRKHTHQVLNLQQVFRPVTLMTRSLTAKNVASSMREAIITMTEGLRGPVHLSLAKDVATQEAVDVPAEEILTVDAVVPTTPKVDGAYRVLFNAKRPVIVVGLGLEPEKPYDELRYFAEVANAPVIDTPKSKGALPADHPLWVGTIGLSHNDPAYEILEEADCIIALGFDVVELVKPWEYTKPLIWVASWENTRPKIHADYEFVGMIAPKLDEFSRSMLQADPDWGAKRVNTYHEYSMNRTMPETDSHHVLPQQVLDNLARFLPRDATISTDVGSHKIFTALNWESPLPNRYFVSNGLSAMGFGLPAAIAAARITNQISVCITGDGGLAMSLGELALIQEMKLPVIIILMNDAALNLIREGQIRSEYPVFGTEFSNPDYEAIARGYNFDFYRVYNSATLSKNVQAAIEKRKPAIVEMLIDPSGYRS